MKWIPCLAIYSICLCSCATDIEKIKKITDEEDDYVERGKEIEMLYSEMGRLKAKIIAPEVSSHKTTDNYSEFGKGLRLYFYTDNLELESKLSANYGVIYHDKEEMIVRDNVVLINIKGEKLNTEELLWKRKDGKIYSEKFVKITTAEEIIYGTGFSAREDFSDYVITNISGIINVEEQ